MKSFPVLTACAAVAAMLGAGAAHAQRVSNLDGNKLLGFCSSKSSSNCDAYLSGIGDAISAEGKEHALACIPVAVTGTQLRDVMVKFLRDHPQDRERKAGTLAVHAFSEAFPCKK